MYEVECLGDRVRVFENGKQYIELDTVTPCDSKNYLIDHYDFLEMLKDLNEDSLEKNIELLQRRLQRQKV